VRPGAHLGGVILVDQAAPDECGEDTGSHASLHVGERRRVEFEGGMKADARRLVRGIVCIGSRLEDAIDDAAMEMDVLVQAGTSTEIDISLFRTQEQGE